MDWKGASSCGKPSFQAISKTYNIDQDKAKCKQAEPSSRHMGRAEVDIDVREVYFLIMHFLSTGPCMRTFGHLRDELLEHQLLPRRYHAWYSRSGTHSGSQKDDGISLPLSYDKLAERYSHIDKDHLLKILKQLILSMASPLEGNAPSAADVPTLLGSGSYSLLNGGTTVEHHQVKHLPPYLRWPHMQADQVHGLSLREIGGGFTKHHRAPSVRAACYAIAKPSMMMQKMQNTKKLRGHRDAVYCAIFDRSGRYVITGSDDRLVKIWSMETAFCLASCRGHEGDITDLAVSANNTLVASASNDFSIRVWRLPDGMPISVLRGHTKAVTAIAFSPRASLVFQLLSSSDDGTCRIWDARHSQSSLQVYLPRPSDTITGKSSVQSSSGATANNAPQNGQILCCAFNADGTVFVTGSSDTYARVWSSLRSNSEGREQPVHELDVLRGHENDVNYVQFSGCSVVPRSSVSDTWKEDHVPKFKNSWFCHNNIVTCSRDGSAIIWIPRSRKFYGKSGRWTKAYHLKVPPPPLPPQPPRGGPRQRLLPTPRGVNMIVWSLDNRFVLAAIMDCRICVWNAADGSLVHCLTGHTESSYVLDVHPFNPRIAMSAGYDGRTIVWDIWEGTPIQIYEIGRFKLVDGKFSQDGTSIVLSDEVGQIHLLNTGQGESQKDAKYDQFFLGDYRPVIRDTAGNVLDQETQLIPHRRNLQDLLCDSSMIPYPEPYQSMYQQRRLGALGFEWRPSSTQFVVGSDYSLGQDYTMPPLADLDIIIEPLPEFLDAMYWEPENEIMSDDADTEYNVGEEYATEVERGGHFLSSSTDLDCSEEDSEFEHSPEDGLRRSSRRKHIIGVELETSVGRRARKRRNSDECHGSTSRSKRTKKSRNDQKALKKGTSKAKARPLRVAARNARTKFSKISGTSTEGNDEDDSSDSLDSASMVQNLNIQSSESNRNVEKIHQKRMEESLIESDPKTKHLVFPESQPNDGKKKKIVLKFSIRGSKNLPPAHSIDNGHDHSGMVHLSPWPSGEHYETNGTCMSSKDTGSTSASGTRFASWKLGNEDIRQTEEPENPLHESADDKVNMTKLGEVRSHSVELLGTGDVMLTGASTELNACFDALDKQHTLVNRGEDLLKGKALNTLQAVEHKKSHFCGNSVSPPLADQQRVGDKSMVSFPESLDIHGKALYQSDSSKDFIMRESNGYGDLHVSDKPKENLPTKLPKFRIKSKVWRDRSPKSKYILTKNDGQGDLFLESPSKLLKLGEPSDCRLNEHRVANDNGAVDKIKTNLDGNAAVLRESAVTAADSHALRTDIFEATTDAINRTRTMKTRETSLEDATNHNFNVRLSFASMATRKKDESSSLKECDAHLSADWASSSRLDGGASSRSRQYGFYDQEPFSAGKKSNKAVKKLSWLMSEHEENRYIPQLGDEVVLLKQGYQEYIKSRGLTEGSPWKKLNRYLNAVEICKVDHLNYATYPGSGDSCCKLTLKFVDPSSGALDKTFGLTLPELVDFPDFIVEKARYDAAANRNWAVGENCRVWWGNSNGEGGLWYDGRITSVQAMSAEFTDSPWERYTVQYQDEKVSHSPWELYDPGTPWENPHIDPDTQAMLLSKFEKLKSGRKHQDKYGIQKVNETAEKIDFLNRFPVPLYPELIWSRLCNHYYRTIEAVQNDARVTILNAQTYFSNDNKVLSKLKRLENYFAKTFSKISGKSKSR